MILLKASAMILVSSIFHTGAMASDSLVDKFEFIKSQQSVSYCEFETIGRNTFDVVFGFNKEKAPNSAVVRKKVAAYKGRTLQMNYKINKNEFVMTTQYVDSEIKQLKPDELGILTERSTPFQNKVVLKNGEQVELEAVTGATNFQKRIYLDINVINTLVKETHEKKLKDCLRKNF